MFAVLCEPGKSTKTLGTINLFDSRLHLFVMQIVTILVQGYIFGTRCQDIGARFSKLGAWAQKDTNRERHPWIFYVDMRKYYTISIHIYL